MEGRREGVKEEERGRNRKGKKKVGRIFIILVKIFPGSVE